MHAFQDLLGVKLVSRQRVWARSSADRASLRASRASAGRPLGRSLALPTPILSCLARHLVFALPHGIPYYPIISAIGFSLARLAASRWLSERLAPCLKRGPSAWAGDRGPW